MRMPRDRSAAVRYSVQAVAAALLVTPLLAGAVSGTAFDAPHERAPERNAAAEPARDRGGEALDLTLPGIGGRATERSEPERPPAYFGFRLGAEGPERAARVGGHRCDIGGDSMQTSALATRRAFC